MMNSIQSHRQQLSPDIDVEPLGQERLARAKAAYTTRHVGWLARTRRTNDPTPVSLLRGDVAPRSGDLVLARVDKLGQHKHLELIDGRRPEPRPRPVGVAKQPFRVVARRNQLRQPRLFHRARR